MIKLYKILAAVLVSLAFIQCSNNKFEISKGKVGKLTTKTTVKEIEQIFANDSIVKVLSEGAKGDNLFQDDDKYYIYEKKGITPAL